MSDIVAAILLALAAENAELREQLAAAQDMLVETAIDAGNIYALVEAMPTERDAWRKEAFAVRGRPGTSPQSGIGGLRSVGLAG